VESAERPFVREQGTGGQHWRVVGAWRFAVAEPAELEAVMSLSVSVFGPEPLLGIQRKRRKRIDVGRKMNIGGDS